MMGLVKQRKIKEVFVYKLDRIPSEVEQLRYMFEVYACIAEKLADLARSWRTADYKRKKAVAMIMIYKIVISEDGGTKVVWNI